MFSVIAGHGGLRGERMSDRFAVNSGAGKAVSTMED